MRLRKFLKVKWFFLSIILLAPYILKGQNNNCNGNPGDVFEITYGGPDDDFVRGLHHGSIHRYPDEYLISGMFDNQGDLEAGVGSVVNIASDGELRWRSGFEGEWETRIIHSIRTNNGNYLCAGYQRTNDNDGRRIFAVMLDPQGDILWQQNYSESGAAFSVEQVEDNRFLINAYTKDLDEANVYDHYPFMIDANGNRLWGHLIDINGGSGSLENNQRQGKILPISEHTNIMGGVAVDANGDGIDDDDISLYKVHNNGDLDWYRSIGGVDEDNGTQLAYPQDNTIFLAATTMSEGAGGSDVYAAQLDTAGNIIWQRTIGGADDESVGGITISSNGNYIITGGTNSFGAGGEDMFIMALDPDGNLLWSRTYGDMGDEYGIDVTQSGSGGLVAYGATESHGLGDFDLYLVRTDACGHSCDDNAFNPEVNNATLEVRDHTMDVNQPPDVFASDMTLVTGGVDSTNVCISLPVSLYRFEGKVHKQDNVQLTWRTLVEKENNYFYVQRSSHGEHYKTIGKVDGYGNVNKVRQYAFTDKNPQAGTNYYRLVQVDYDGSRKVHKSITVHVSGNISFGVHPNPFIGSARLTITGEEGIGEEGKTARLTVSDLTGKVVRKRTEVIKGRSIKVGSGLPAGVYILKVEMDDKMKTFRIVKH